MKYSSLKPSSSELEPMGWSQEGCNPMKYAQRENCERRWRTGGRGWDAKSFKAVSPRRLERKGCGGRSSEARLHWRYRFSMWPDLQGLCCEQGGCSWNLGARDARDCSRSQTFGFYSAFRAGSVGCAALSLSSNHRENCVYVLGTRSVRWVSCNSKVARRIWDDINRIEQTTISWAAATRPLRKLKQRILLHS